MNDRKNYVLSLIIISIVLVSLIVSSCSDVKLGLETKEEAEVDRPIQIGFSFDSFVIERWLRDRDAFVLAAKDLGAEVNVQTANGDVDEQIDQLEYFIDQKMDVIVIVATDSDALSQVIEKAETAGIQVIAYDRLIKNTNVDLYISFDSEKVGYQMGQVFSDTLSDNGQICMINGPWTDYNVSLLEEGFQEALEGTSLEITHKYYCDNWSADEGADYAEELLKENRGIDGIMCGNDDIATRVFQVLAEERLAGKVNLVGQDADLAACQRIVEGTQMMTVYKPVEDLAKAAAYFAVKLAKEKRGETMTEELENYSIDETINDGTYDIPYYHLDGITVTKENIEDVIIKSGFHSREDIYLNVK